MKHKGRFQKVGTSHKKKMYGPQKLLVCGYAPQEQASFLQFLEVTRAAHFPVLFATETDLDKTLQEILAQEHQAGFEQASPMQRVVIMSGVTGKEMQSVMQGFKKTEFPAQHWAALTPTSETWTLQNLLQELEAEGRAMQAKGKG